MTKFLNILKKWLIIMLLVHCTISCLIVSEAEVRNFNRLVGSYQPDISKTDLGVYKKNSDLYKNLTITFYA